MQPFSSTSSGEEAPQVHTPRLVLGFHVDGRHHLTATILCVAFSFRVDCVTHTQALNLIWAQGFLKGFLVVEVQDGQKP